MQIQREKGAVGDIEAVSELELIFLARLHKESLGGTTPAGTGSTKTLERGGGTVGTKELANGKVANGRDEKGGSDEMEEDEVEGEVHNCAKGWVVRETPGDGREKKEEGEEVCK